MSQPELSKAQHKYYQDKLARLGEMYDKLVVIHNKLKGELDIANEGLLAAHMIGFQKGKEAKKNEKG
jgi:hypothetical protein